MGYKVCKNRRSFDFLSNEQVDEAIRDVSSLKGHCGECIFRVECFRNFLTLQKAMEVAFESSDGKGSGMNINLRGLNIYVPTFPKGNPTDGFVRWQEVECATIEGAMETTEQMLKDAFGELLLIKADGFYVRLDDLIDKHKGDGEQ